MTRQRRRPTTFTGQVRDLVAFYRNGATVAPPQRELDRSHCYHRALVLGHVAACVWVGALILDAATSTVPRALTAAGFAYLGHKTVDPVNGLVHFTLDNYFSVTTPIVGGVVDGFLDHHERPATISRIQFARNVGALVALSLPFLALLVLLRPMETIAGLATSSFVGTFFAESGFSMEAHKYAHISRRKLPAALRWLQRHQWLVSHELHRGHHLRRPGHEADYAAVTGQSNRYLTSVRLRRVERAIHRLTRWLTGVGVEPRSWRDPAVRTAAFAAPQRSRTG